MPFTKQQFVITHTMRLTEIPALLDGWVKHKLSVKMLCPQKNASLYIYAKTQHSYALVY